MIWADGIRGTPSDIWPGLGLAGAIVIGALAIGTVLLWLNMRRQLKRIRVPTEAQFREQDRARRAAKSAASPRGDGEAKQGKSSGGDDPGRADD